MFGVEKRVAELSGALVEVVEALDEDAQRFFLGRGETSEGGEDFAARSNEVLAGFQEDFEVILPAAHVGFGETRDAFELVAPVLFGEELG